MATAGVPVRGPDFTASCSTDCVIDAFATSGLQATKFAEAERLLASIRDSKARGAIEGKRVGVVLAYTSNMVSCGLRDVFTFLVQCGHVDVVMSTAGGLEEDVIKCLGDTVLGDFALKGAELRLNHLNRVGNLLIPNTNYANFEDFFVPVLAKVHREQCVTGCASGTTPSEILKAMGDQLVTAPGVPVTNVDQSVVATCFHKGVPMFCPAFTDGSMGDMLFFYNINFPGMVVDPLADERKLRQCLTAFDEVNVISVGAGLPKHNALRAAVSCGNLARVLLMTTSSVLDGCASAGDPRDDLSTGQLTSATEYVRLNTEATLVFPLLVARVFAKGN